MAASLAERLGFGPGERIAVLHADDIGMCQAANQGAFDTLERGAVTCGSIMVPCPWFREAAARARARPELDLGVHLTLNAEWDGYRWGPVAGAAAVPSLVDGEGALPRTSAEVAQKARPEHVERELRAQVETALAAGIDVTHLDSHMGTCLSPPFLEIYARLARDYRLPVLAVRPDRELLAARGLGGAGALVAKVLDALEAARAPILDALDADSLSFAPGAGEAHNRRRLAGLRPGVTYLICHPARAGAELDAVVGEQAHAREFERAFWTGEAGRRALAEEGVRLVGMRPLRELMRAGAPGG